MTQVSLYLHIPFCTSKCDYCDFYSVPDNYNDGYIDVLLKETERRLRETANASHEAIVIPSVYIGGGTPSLLGASGITRLLEGLRAITGAAIPGPACEITVEANPETANLPFLKACAETRVTRLSMGVQSFNGAYRKALGRNAGKPLDEETLTRRLSDAADLFGYGLSVDLLCACLEKGSFERQKDILLYDIEKTLSFGPGHVSLYALSLEQNPPLAARLEKGSVGDLTDRLWLLGRDTLVKAGYEQYEISNFALPGFRCVHNIRYWRMENWIGTGPGASGTILKNGGGGPVYGWCTSYAPDVDSFIAGKAKPLTEALDRLTAVKETLLMGFRYKEGPDPVLFKKRFGKSIEETIPKTLEKWREKKRMLFLNAFLIDAFQEVENKIELKDEPG